jgi:hypothetical protein
VGRGPAVFGLLVYVFGVFLEDVVHDVDVVAERSDVESCHAFWVSFLEVSAHSYEGLGHV